MLRGKIAQYNPGLPKKGQFTKGVPEREMHLPQRQFSDGGGCLWRVGV